MKILALIYVAFFGLTYAQLPYLLSEEKVAGLLNDFVGDLVSDYYTYKGTPTEAKDFKCLLAPFKAILKDPNDFFGLFNTIVYTGKQILDIGDQDSCSLYEENRYVLATNGEDNKGLVRPVLGICAPRECSLQDVSFIFKPILGTCL